MKICKQIRPSVDWSLLDTVLLDMDGTLLDRYFDDHFWLDYVPEVYARKHNLALAAAKDILYARFRREEGKLQWTDLDFWSRELGLDIPWLKTKKGHFIQVHPHAIDFLRYLNQAGKRVFLVTNAHDKSLVLKLRKTRLGQYFDDIVCSLVVGVAKEDPIFWDRLEKLIGFEPHSTMLADDTERVLHSAHRYGIGSLIHVARPSSKGPVTFSATFSSIEYFDELIPDHPFVSASAQPSGAPGRAQGPPAQQISTS